MCFHELLVGLTKMKVVVEHMVDYTQIIWISCFSLVMYKGFELDSKSQYMYYREFSFISYANCNM